MDDAVSTRIGGVMELLTENQTSVNGWHRRWLVGGVLRGAVRGPPAPLQRALPVPAAARHTQIAGFAARGTPADRCGRARVGHLRRRVHASAANLSAFLFLFVTLINNKGPVTPGEGQGGEGGGGGGEKKLFLAALQSCCERV